MYIIDGSDKLEIGQKEQYLYLRSIVWKTFLYDGERIGDKIGLACSSITNKKTICG